MLETLTRFEFADFAFRDSVKTVALATLTFMLIFLALSWIQTNVVGQTQIITIFVLFFALFVGAYYFNKLKQHIGALESVPFGTIAYGSNLKVVVIMSLIGLGFGYFLVSQAFTISLPLDVTFNQQIISMDFIYKVGMSPILEEFFRGVMLITFPLIAWFLVRRNWTLALLIGLIASSLIFGVFHFLAYQQEFVFIGAAIIFGFIAGLLMLLSKSVWPAIAFHFANNQLIYADGDPTIVMVVGGILLALLALSLVRRI